jgi:hypothetical protein
VATTISFVGGDGYIVVDESPVEVQSAFNAAGGLPFILTREGGGKQVFVNPSAIKHWSEREERSGTASFQ